MSPIQTYLLDNSDSRVSRRQAAQSNLPNSNINGFGSYQGINRPVAGTSMMIGGHSSLAALTRISSVSSAPSVSTSMGERHLTPRLLENDSGGVLQVAPLRGRVVFQCPFNFLNCLLEFSDFTEWFRHSLRHWNGVTPPISTKCCFCDQVFRNQDGSRSWRDRMEHVAIHHRSGCRVATSRPDFELYRFLWNNRLIETALYKALTMTSNSRSDAENAYPSPPISPTGSTSHSSMAVYTVTNSSSRRDRRPARRS